VRYLYAMEFWSRRLLDRGQRALLGKALITCADCAAPLPAIWRGIPPRGHEGAHAARARTGCFGAIGSRRSQIQLPLSAESGHG
jgi:hypothetical protein